ncbi:MAG: ANTH domain-containing protein [Monoraphidium minutum]|nr:MAG: ANTH domain-containing protein [Monoraphidium minutum]
MASEAALKDKAKLALASDLYVAVTKAALAEEVVPKEKHVRSLKIACSALAPRQQVDYVIYKLGKRLAGPGWVVALKALMVFHRLLRECDATFQVELLIYLNRTGRQRMLCLDRFADNSGREAWDYSAFVRAYSVYLDERLDAFRRGGRGADEQQQQYTGGYGASPRGGSGGGAGYGASPRGGGYGGYGGYGSPPGAVRYATPSPTGGFHAAGVGSPRAAGAAGWAAAAAGGGADRAPVSLKDCSAADLLEHLPRVQRLMLRAAACVPEGAAAGNLVCMTAASWVLRDARSVYRAASEGVINLADKFFEMTRDDALRGLELYREALALHEKLAAYYAAMQAIPALRAAALYPDLHPLPQDFVATMEEYLRGVARGGAAPASPRSRKQLLPSAKLGRIAALGGTTSSALTSEGERQEAPRGGAGGGGGAQAAAAAASLHAAGRAEEPTAAAPPAPAPGSPQPQPFGSGAAVGAARPPPLQQPYGGYGGGYGGFGGGYGGGYAAQPTGFGYAPQMTGYIYAPQATGGGGAMALVPAGAIPMNPFMAPPGGYGPPPPFGLPSGAAPGNPFAPPSPGGGGGNPFGAPSPREAAAGGGGGFVGRRLEGDPLNELTDKLLGALPKPKAAAEACPQRSLRDLKVASAAAAAAAAAPGAGAAGPGAW